MYLTIMRIEGCLPMEVDEEREVDDEADAALEQCALAARTHHWTWTQGELRLMYGRSADVDAVRRLKEAPFDVLSEYQARGL